MPTTSTISAAPTDLAHDLGVFEPEPKGLWRDRRVAERTWRAPHLVGREEVLAAQERGLRTVLDRDGRAVLSIVGGIY